MKFSTLTLPTGEFILIVSEAVREAVSAELDQFKDSIGAAGIWVTSEPVEVDDAVIQEGAVRRNVPQPDSRSPLRGPYQRLHIPRATDRARSLDFTDESWTFDPKLVEHILAGREFSPAGLVKLSDEEKAELNKAANNPVKATAGTQVAWDPFAQTEEDLTAADAFPQVPWDERPKGEPCPCYPHADQIDANLAGVYGRCGDCPIRRDGEVE